MTPESAVPIPDADLQRVLEEVRVLSAGLSSQVFAVVPFQVLLATAFGAAEHKGGVSVIVAEAVVASLGLSIAATVLALGRVHGETLAHQPIALRPTFVRREAQRVKLKAALVRDAVLLLIPAAALVALAAIESL